MEWEVGKILGGVADDKKSFSLLENTVVSATCTRVPVLDGHLETVSVKFANGSPSLEQVNQVLEKYSSEAEKLQCHSAPEKPIVVTYDADRPQPRLDQNALF
ncbi:hypothetical protein G6F68_020494 [Rhizopus microsporus]|nr:hypothetical protein G6F68_020494 [Rhizopus microsporus]